LADKIIVSCHYCGTTKEEFEIHSKSARGLHITYRPASEAIEKPESKMVWFCSRMHADYWIEQYKTKVEIVDDKAV